MVYLGTTVATGKGEAVVVATGMQTELGRIAGLLESQPREPTPLERRLDELGKILMVRLPGARGHHFRAANLARRRVDSRCSCSSVSLAVAAVPEGLPAVVTLALALGLERMIKRNALDPQAAQRRDAGLGDRDLLGQDRHADAQRNDRPRNRPADAATIA